MQHLQIDTAELSGLYQVAVTELSHAEIINSGLFASILKVYLGISDLGGCVRYLSLVRSASFNGIVPPKLKCHPFITHNMPVVAVVTFSNPHGVSWRKRSPPNASTVEHYNSDVLECKKNPTTTR